MTQIAEGLIYSSELNKIVYSNEFIINSGLNLETVSKILGDYAEYISDNEKDLLYARASGIKIFDETVKEFNYKLSGMVDIEKEIEQLKETPISNTEHPRVHKERSIESLPFCFLPSVYLAKNQFKARKSKKLEKMRCKKERTYTSTDKNQM